METDDKVKNNFLRQHLTIFYKHIIKNYLYYLIFIVLVILFGFLIDKIANKLLWNKLNVPTQSLYLFNKNNNYLTKFSKDAPSGTGQLELKLNTNDNLFYALTRENFDNENINFVLHLLNKHINLRNLKENQKFHINYSFTNKFVKITPKKHNSKLPKREILKEIRYINNMSFKLPNGDKYNIENIENNYIVHIEKPKLIVKTHIISGTIQNNLFTDVLVSDINVSTLYNTLNEYAFLIDFQRDLRQGDKFIFVLETTRDGDGDFLSEKVLYSNLILSEKNYEIFNFHNKFYDRNGKSVHKNLLKTPVDGARISSGFNSRRKHPILGYTRAHKGIDLAVPMGTPIYAAGDGHVVEIQLDHHDYGKFITIKHNREYSTRYAHMSRIAHLKIGQQVKQRQVIGYVGMTGLATGPHLHYEVMQYGKHINPKHVKAIETKKIEENKIAEYKQIIKNIDKILNNQ